MKTLKAHSTRIVLVRQNQIPTGKLFNPKYIEEMRKLFQFGTINLLQDPTGATSGINYTNGLYSRGNGKEFAIEDLTVEARKINFRIEGSSEDADSFYAKLKKLFSDLVDLKQDDLFVPVIAVDETELISVLSFPVEKLFSETFLNQITQNLVNKASNDFAKARLGNAVASFHLDYEPIDFSLIADSRININRKEFTIQVAPGYGLTDKVYATKAPLDSQTHIALLKEVEKTFGK